MSAIPHPEAPAPGGASVSASEKDASTPVSAATASVSAKKPRSCVVCRSRKVRCDKQSPCSNCRRANIACVVPSADRPPKWARRLERITHDAAATTASPPGPTQDPSAHQVMERLRSLEGLVKELSGQLEVANAAASSAAGSSPGAGGSSPGKSRDEDKHTSPAGIHKHFGRLVVQDPNRSRYVSSGFWSRVSDELDGLKMDARGLQNGDSDSSDDEEEDSSPGKTSSSIQGYEHTPSERHAFLFGHNLGPSTPDLRDFRPLPSQIPFLLDIYSENVNGIMQVVHMPTITKMVRGSRGSSLTPANEALMFSIYFAAVTSMEEDDVVASFGATKAELNRKYRLGFEHALAKADFLNVPDLVVIQAFAIFLCLVRRHESPRFVWMMAGLVIRMAQSIGLHRDGSNFRHLTPFAVEMRRRAWWLLCVIDIRASEDQGTDFTITSGSFDTRLPLNINDADISPETVETPAERNDTLTDMSMALANFEMGNVTRRIMATKDDDGNSNLEGQSRLLDSFYQKMEQRYLGFTTPAGNIAYWVGVTIARLVISKMTLFVYLPALFASPSERFSDEVRSRLLVAAIEVAEHNHELNAEQACRQWRWIYQTYTHWHAIVYLLIEICRRPWSPIVERAWTALHSPWLIPESTEGVDRNSRVWIPLRKLMAKARRHRETELERIRRDGSLIAQLEALDRAIPVPGSSGPFPAGQAAQSFLHHWRCTLNAMPAEPAGRQQSAGSPHSYHAAQAAKPSLPMSTTPLYGQQTVSPMSAADLSGSNSGSGIIQGTEQSLNHMPSTLQTDAGLGFTPWLWADADASTDALDLVDVNMDLDLDVDWNSWLESTAANATSMDWWNA